MCWARWPGSNDGQSACPVLISEGTVLPGENHRITCFYKDCEKSIPFMGIEGMLGLPLTRAPFSKVLLLPWISVPISCIKQPFRSLRVAIYKFFLLVYALSSWVSVRSYPPNRPLISWAESMMSLCSKKSWHSALWTGCWHTGTELRSLARWTLFPGCTGSFWGISVNIAHRSCLFSQ